MSKNLPSTYRLVDRYLITAAVLENAEENKPKLEQKLQKLEEQILEKHNNIRFIKDRYKYNLEQLKAEKKFYLEKKREVHDKIKKYQKAFNRLEHMAIDIIETVGKKNQSDNYNLQTDLGSFTAVEYSGKTIILDKDKVPKDCKTTKTVTKIDKRKVKQKVLEEGQYSNGYIETEYAKVIQKKRLNVN